MASLSMDQRRILMKDSLDRLSDFVVEAGEITFRHTFEMVEADETFCTAPPDIIDAARRLLELNLDQCLAKIVHDNDTLKFGGNRVPLFAMVSGGRSRTLYSLWCVFPNCSAFLDVRTLPHANCVKWVIMGISHNHVFATFPVRVPRGIFTAASKEGYFRNGIPKRVDRLDQASERHPVQQECPPECPPQTERCHARGTGTGPP